MPPLKLSRLSGTKAGASASFRNNRLVKMRKLAVALLLLCGMAFASHPIAHVLAGEASWKLTDRVLHEYKLDGFGIVAKPVAAMASHIGMDLMVSEAGLGEYQVQIGIVRVVIGFFLKQEGKERDEYLQYAFWSLLPDVIDKSFGKNYFHRLNGKPLIVLDRDANELLDEICLGMMIFRFSLPIG